MPYLTTSNQQPSQQPRPFSNGYLPNGAPPTGPSGPVPGAQPLLPNQGRVIQSGATRILCVADVRGMHAVINIPPTSPILTRYRPSQISQ